MSNRLQSLGVPPIPIKPPLQHMRHDLSSPSGARLLVEQIEAAWKALGFDSVRCWVDPSPVVYAGAGGGKAVYRICSNLINGLPPRVKK